MKHMKLRKWSALLFAFVLAISMISFPSEAVTVEETVTTEAADETNVSNTKVTPETTQETAAPGTADTTDSTNSDINDAADSTGTGTNDAAGSTDTGTNDAAGSTDTGADDTTDSTEVPSVGKVDINEVDVELTGAEDLVYTGSALTPAVTAAYKGNALSAEDYTAVYTNNINAGTAAITLTGTGLYTGTKTVSFTIQPKNINDPDVIFGAIADKTYKASAYKPSVNIQYNGMKLVRKAGNDYLAAYKNNINVGTATGTVTGIGNYTGKRSVTFNIVAKNISTVTCSSVSNKVYTGSKITPAVTLRWNLTEDNGNVQIINLVNNTDYTITYTDNKNVGIAGILINGKGNYGGSKLLTFTIKPKPVTLKKLQRGKKRFTAKWSSQTKQATGYIVQYSTKSTFKGSTTKSVKIKKSHGTKLIKKGLKAKVRYYVRVRTYKNVNGIKYYSSWSNVKSIKTKK